MKKLRVLDLFSGIGGFSLGLERAGGFETVAFCEIEDFPRKVLAKHWPEVPIFEDVRKLKGEEIGAIDVICGGYPCQPFSHAGKRRGKEDDRHLWPEFNRLVAALRPAWVIGENVAGHIGMGLDHVLSDLEGQGYACRSLVIPACAVDAPHRRDRVWIVANRQKQLRNGDAIRPGGKNGCEEWIQKPTRGSCAVADADSERLQGRQDARDSQSQRQRCYEHVERCADLPGAVWCPEPAVGRVANGVPQRVDRLKALGNAVVPQIPEMIGRAIMEAEGMT